MKCSDCKWWVRRYTYFGEQWGCCELTISQSSSPKYPDGLAYAQDHYWGYRASLETSENFGCVQFQEQIEEAQDVWQDCAVQDSVSDPSVDSD